MTVFRFTGASGVVQQCQLETRAAVLRVVNTSKLDLNIAFGISQPPPFAVQPSAYRNVVPSGDRTSLVVPADPYGSFQFPGYVYVCPVDNTSSFALTGTASNNLGFFIETYGTGEQIPNDFSAPQFQNAANQPRIVSIPLALVGGLDTASGSLHVAATGHFPLISSSVSAGKPIAPSTIFSIYLWQFLLFPNATATATIIDFEILTAIYNVSSTEIASFSEGLLRARIVSPASSGNPQQLIYTPANPVVGQLTFNTAGGLTIGLTMNVTTISATQDFGYYIAASVDPTNYLPPFSQAVPASPGNFLASGSALF